MIKAIIFDLGGVILRHRSDLMGHIISEMFATPKNEANKIWNQYRIKLLKGELSSRQFLNDLSIKFKTKHSLDELFKMWNDLYAKQAKIDEQMLKFVEELREKYKVYLLTDTTDVHDEYNKNRGIYDQFDKVFKSFEERLAKAEGSAIYLDVLKKINLKPNECIFIDDLAKQVESAVSLGIKGILFTNLAQLKKDLANEL